MSWPGKGNKRPGIFSLSLAVHKFFSPPTPLIPIFMATFKRSGHPKRIRPRETCTDISSIFFWPVVISCLSHFPSPALLDCGDPPPHTHTQRTTDGDLFVCDTKPGPEKKYHGNKFPGLQISETTQLSGGSPSLTVVGHYRNIDVFSVWQRGILSVWLACLSAHSQVITNLWHSAEAEHLQRQGGW